MYNIIVYIETHTDIIYTSLKIDSNFLMEIKSSNMKYKIKKRN